MEAIKAEILKHLIERYDECAVSMDCMNMCAKIGLQCCPNHIIYVERDDAQSRYMCHYMHREDVGPPRSCGFCVWMDGRFKDEAAPSFNGCTCSESKEMLEWVRQRRQQMPRIVKGTYRQFASVACKYVDDAVQRIRNFGEIDSRAMKVMTFREARLEAELYPEPQPKRKRDQRLPFRWSEKNSRRIIWGLTEDD